MVLAILLLLSPFSVSAGGNADIKVPLDGRSIGQEEAILSPDEAALSAVPPNGRPLVRFGFLKPMLAYGENNYQPGETDIRRPLVAHLRRMMPDVHFQFIEYELPALSEAVKRHEVDYALMSAGQYVELRSYGAYALATVYTARFPDPNRFTAALFVTTADHPEIQTIADVKGARAVFNSQANFINYQLPLAAIANAGFNPDRFFFKQYFTNDKPQEVLRLLLERKADIGVFRVCEYETLIAKWPQLKQSFRPTALVSGGNQSCLRSTELFPGWTVALTTDNMAPQLTKRMVETILAMPIDPSSGMGWSVATEFSRVNDVFHVLRIGPYAYLRDWTLSRIWRDFWPLIAAALALLAGFVFHSVSVERLAQSRARELNDAYVRQREIEDKALKTEERLAALSRLGVVSQLSSIFAHEMGQPLSAIRYRARALKTLLAAPTPRRDLMNDCLKTIDAQSAKAARILQKVRAYAKGETSREAPVRLDLLVETAAADLRRLGRLTVPTRVKTVEVEIPGDELELGLAVLNILKNAAEAAAGGINGEDGASVRVNLSANGRCARLQVVNTGRRLAPGELERHMAPMSSEKKEGIGLGIVIIQSIAEAHGGSFSLRALEAGGAEAVLELPLKFEGETADREIQETCDVKKSMPSGLAPNTLDNKEEPKK